MKTKRKDIIMQNKIFLWIAVMTVLLLLIPVIGMQISSGWNWTLSDFIFAFVMIFGFASLFVLAARKWAKHRILLAIIILLVFLSIWAEFAVGIFTHLGS